VIDAGERSLAIAAEQIARPPTELCRSGGPSVVEETAAVVNET
jgi:hypothetical protein